MSAPWLDRLPTPEEVEAHATEHGVEYGCAGRIGLWMLREEHEPVPLCGELQLGRGGSEGWDYLWNPHIGEHEGGDTVKLGPGDRLCPLTAEGFPVALVTEVEQLRADVAAERALREGAQEHHTASLRCLDAILGEPDDGETRLKWTESAAQKLVSERDGLREEVKRLRAIVEGRTTAPTDAEIAAHPGPWLVQYGDGGYDVLLKPSALVGAKAPSGHSLRPARWWPLGHGSPCAWSEVRRG